MITSFDIENYKSINNLSLKLGRVNVFIGENGCGKSNILEAFALASAASQNKLDNEYLAARGIRVTKPQLMRSAFDIASIDLPVKLSLTLNKQDEFSYELNNNNDLYSKWNFSKSNSTELAEQFSDKSYSLWQNNSEFNSRIKFHQSVNNEIFIKDFFKDLYSNLDLIYFSNFLIYSPENTSLRTFEKEGQIEPLGIYGEGLFKLLKYFATQKDSKFYDEIKNYLNLFGWFKDFKMPENLFEGESFLRIKDKYLDDKIDFFDQKSANEGFLFVLFYISLFISDKTPSFFAIDNIEASLNPKLCTKLVKSISELSKKYDKQVLLTTHSASALDGLDLNDEEQKLFLVYRNKLGHTIVNEVKKPKPLEGQETIKLSEAFLRGYLGGLPKNFSL